MTTLGSSAVALSVAFISFSACAKGTRDYRAHTAALLETGAHERCFGEHGLYTSSVFVGYEARMAIDLIRVAGPPRPQDTIGRLEISDVTVRLQVRGGNGDEFSYWAKAVGYRPTTMIGCTPLGGGEVGDSEALERLAQWLESLSERDLGVRSIGPYGLDYGIEFLFNGGHVDWYLLELGSRAQVAAALSRAAIALEVSPAAEISLGRTLGCDVLTVADEGLRAVVVLGVASEHSLPEELPMDRTLYCGISVYWDGAYSASMSRLVAAAVLPSPGAAQSR